MLTLADRIAYQRAIEEVYWRHRIWPKERPDPKPSLDEVMPPMQLEKKVEDYLRNSQALEDYWQQPLSAEQLQAEMERMAQFTKQPEVLRELFEALGNDPFVIAECLARPALAERWLGNLYAYDTKLHGELKRRAESELRAHSSIQQMKQTSGNYREIEWVRDNSARDKDKGTAEPGFKLSNLEWDENVQRVAALFGGSLLTHIEAGVFSRLQEDNERYYTTAIIEKSKDRLKLATVEWRKKPLDSWINGAESRVLMATARADYALPKVSEVASGCDDNTWAPSSLNTPTGRSAHTVVWTGSEIIIWGGGVGYPSTAVNRDARYNLTTGAWTIVSTANAPFPRGGHSAVWTGSEMIIWGGGWLNTGGRYNPSTDSWIPTSTINAPTGRSGHTAVWTGNQMIVWGGARNNGIFNTGGRYNPSTNTWAATSTTGAPTPRNYHTAVWTGGQMIVWGGIDVGHNYLNTGGRYNPSTNSWTTTSALNAPTGRYLHTAVWTGSEMIVWAGWGISPLGTWYLNTGGKYNPGTNSWTATNTVNAPSARDYHMAVWTGSEMIIWGGTTSSGSGNTGGRYQPGTNSWTPTSLTNAPPARTVQEAVWTGTEMFIWGGEGGSSTGGRYRPSTNTWILTDSAPSDRLLHTAVWTGSEMIVWGGMNGYVNLNTGGRYLPSTDRWEATTTTNAPSTRAYHTAVWTGSQMIVWGGINDLSGSLNTGGRYNPATNSWTPTSIANAPSHRSYHTGVWTGTQMIVWGGHDTGGNVLNTGGRYNPSANTWAPTSITNAPIRSRHTAVWTGDEMIIWGGTNNLSTYLNTGARYNPSSDTWVTASITNAPSARFIHTAIWSGSEMIVWGGEISNYNSSYFNTGGRYNPDNDTWTATSTINAPTARGAHTAIWTGNEMIVWGGGLAVSPYWSNTGGRYNPATDIWINTSIAKNAPIGRYSHTAVWTGSEMIVWAGSSRFGFLNGGGRYCAQIVDSPQVYDFNHDDKPDYVLYNGATRRTAIWYMDNNVYAGGAPAPTLPIGWNVIDVADFNRDGANDYALFNSSTRQTVIWYLSGVTYIGGAYGPILPSGWALVAAADFNNDGGPDYVLYKASTRQTAILYLSNNAYEGEALGLNVPAGWNLVGVADFNRDGKPDYLLFNPSSRYSAIWYLSGTTRIGAAYGPTIAAGYDLTGAGDFNGDSKPDYVLYNANTHETALSYLNNNVYIGSAVGPTLPAGWNLVRP